MNKRSRAPINALVLALPETAGSALYGIVDVLAATATLWREPSARTLAIADRTPHRTTRLFRCGNVPKPAGYPVFLKTVRQKGAHGAAFGYNALQATHERGASAVSSTVAASLLRVGNRHQRQRSSQRKKGWRTSKSALTMLHQFGFIAYES